MNEWNAESFKTALQGLERSAVKVACCVPMGLGGGNALWLPGESVETLKLGSRLILLHRLYRTCMLIHEP